MTLFKKLCTLFVKVRNTHEKDCTLLREWLYIADYFKNEMKKKLILMYDNTTTYR